MSENTKRLDADVDLDALMDAPLEATGSDVPDGSYPATLFGYTKPFKLEVAPQFRKPGGPTHKTVFEMRFGLLDQKGQLVELDKLVNVPDGGGANRKSNLYKALRSLAPEKFDEEGSFKKGVNLKSFIGQQCVLGVKKNKQDWPAVETINPRMAGAKYPTVDECREKLTGSQDIPF